MQVQSPAVHLFSIGNVMTLMHSKAEVLGCMGGCLGAAVALHLCVHAPHARNAWMLDVLAD